MSFSRKSFFKISYPGQGKEKKKAKDSFSQISS